MIVSSVRRDLREDHIVGTSLETRLAARHHVTATELFHRFTP